MSNFYNPKELVLFHIFEKKLGGMINPYDFNLKYKATRLDITPQKMDMSVEFKNSIIASVYCDGCNSNVNINLEQITLAIVSARTVNNIFELDDNNAKKFIGMYKYIADSVIGGNISFIIFVVAIPFVVTYILLCNKFSKFFYTGHNELIITLLLIVLFIITGGYFIRRLMRSTRKKEKEIGKKDVVIVINSKEMHDYLFNFPGVTRVTLVKRVELLDDLHLIDMPKETIYRVPPKSYTFKCHPETNCFYTDTNIFWEYDGIP